jgi:cell division protein FtsI (penicillin-binding protein 3)
MTEELQMICNKFGISNHYNGAEKWVKSTVSNRSILWVSKPIEPQTVPDVSGLTLRDALYILENKGLRVNYSGKGRVVSQSLPIGSAIKKNDSIKIILG